MLLSNLIRAIESLGYVEIKATPDEDQVSTDDALTEEQSKEMRMIFRQTIDELAAKIKPIKEKLSNNEISEQEFKELRKKLFEESKLTLKTRFAEARNNWKSVE